MWFFHAGLAHEPKLHNLLSETSQLVAWTVWCNLMNDGGTSWSYEQDFLVFMRLCSIPTFTEEYFFDLSLQILLY